MCDIIHLKAPVGTWINDPNGFIYYKGEYHLFYQTFPYAPIWGRMHWGHAVSRDLIHWEHKGIALFPSKTDDRSGCFSGSAIEHNGKMYLYYTGVNYFRENPENINHTVDDGFISAQLMITSDDGYSFDNFDSKKTVIPPIADKSIGDETHTRDPKVWQGKDGNWYMVMGTSVNHRGRLIFYKSSDLENWEYVNYCEKDNLGWMWECPDYFEVNGQSIVIFSPMKFINDGLQYDSATVCYKANFEEKTCTMTISEKYQFLDYGFDLYASQSTLDKDGRRIIVAWLRMPERMDNNRIGMMSMPRVVEIENGHIYFRPHPDIASRFTKEISALSKAEDTCCKISAKLENGEKINIGGYVIARENDKIYADRSAVNAGHEEIRSKFETPKLSGGNTLDIYVDKNIIEVYINDGEYVITNAVYGLSDEISGKDCKIYTIE
jgi:beta-fructofuranosidase